MKALAPILFFTHFFMLAVTFASSAHGATQADAVKKHVRTLTATMGTCACTRASTTAEADETLVGATTLKDLHGDEFKVSVMNDVYALKLFQEITVQRKIPFGFPEDGCFARAHEMSFQLGKKGVATGKIFATGSFRIDSEKAPNGSVTWGFHVAPFFVVDDGKTREIWVIDPSLFYEPTSLESWLSQLTSHRNSRIDTVYITNRYIYHPSQKNRRLSAFDPEDLKKSDRIMKRYLKRQTLREKKSTGEL